MNDQTTNSPDRTRNDRQRRRREKLDRAARRKGFNSWSHYETWVIGNETDWFAEIDNLQSPPK